MRKNQLVFSILLGAALFAYAAVPARADCSWAVSGTVKVQSQIQVLINKFGEQIALKGIKVRVSGATVGSIFDSWGEVTTDANGKFTLKKEKSCADRKIKIEVQFQNSNVEIRDDKLAGVIPNVPWYTIVEDSEKRRKAGAIQILPTVFNAGKLHDLDDPIARHHADIWVLANTLRDHLAGYGSQFKFTEKSILKYPNNEAIAPDKSEASFTHPVTHVVNLFKSNDGTNDHMAAPGGSSVVFHEMMHAWAFARVGGELVTATNLVTSFSTHCFNDEQHVSWHEAFADFARERLQKEIFGTAETLPFNRDALKEGLKCEGSVDKMPTIAEMEKHELGWGSLFRMLTTNNLKGFTYSGEANSTEPSDSSVFIASAGPMIARDNCTNPTNHRLKNILDVFLAHPTQGVPGSIAKNEMRSFDAYLRRAAKILGFEDQRVALMNLLNPAKTSEPVDELCGEKATVPLRPVRRPIRP